jgi:hypothetical protein
LTVLLVGASLTAGVSSAGIAYQAQDDGPSEAAVDSDEVFWQGQFLELSAGEANASEVWSVRSVDDGEVGGLVTEVLLDDSGSATFGTTGLDGQYVIVDEQGEPVAFENGSAVGRADVSDAGWEVAVQTLNATFDEATVRNDDSAEARVDLRIESNRADYPIRFFSEQLSAEEIADVFADVEVQDGQAVATRTVGDDTVFDANFSGVEAGTYNVTVAAADASARDTASIVVSEPVEGSASLANATVVEQRGDVARFNVTLDGTDEATVTVGSRGVGYLARFGVVDEDGDGQVAVEVNTYRAGQANQSGISAVGEDNVTGYELQTDPIPGRLDVATYPIRTFVGGQQTAVGTLILEEPSIDGVRVWTAPDVADVQSPSQLTDIVAQDDTIAYQDLAVVEIRASGLAGYVQNLSDLNGNETGLSMTLTRGAEMNVPETEVPLDQATLIHDEGNDQLFLVFDSTRLEQDVTYTANFTVTERNPYVSAQNASSYTADFTVVERTASFDEPIEVPASSDAAITGSSTVAPGTELTVQVESVGANPFFDRQTVEVGEDGSWEAAFDLSGVSNGTEFTATIDDPAANATGVVVTEGAAEGEETAAEETTEVEEDAEATTAAADDDAEATTEAAEEDAEETTEADEDAADEETTAADEEEDAAEATTEAEADAEATTAADGEDAAADEETETPDGEADATDEETVETTTEEEVASASTPGFGPVVVVLAAALALAGAALVARRR